jgi:hypothetical protein
LVAEEAVHDDALVPSVRVALGYGLSVRLRTGELLHADGSSGIVIDTLVGRAVLPTDSAPAMRLELYHIFASETVWSGEPKAKGGVDQRFIPRVRQPKQLRPPGLRMLNREI